MIPENSEELHMLAREFVLGVLDADEAREVTTALVTNAELRRAVAFWEEQIHPLSTSISLAEPPRGTWQAIEARIKETAPKPATQRYWNDLALWRWSTAAFAAAAASLALWIALTPVPGPSFVAVLHPPQQDQTNGWPLPAPTGCSCVLLLPGSRPTDRAPSNFGP